MFYYSHHIGDFRSGCHNMTRQERWLYRDMLDVYYDTEKPLPDSLEEICKLIGSRGETESAMVSEILSLKFQKTDQGWWHERCDLEIKKFHKNVEQASNAGKASAASRSAKAKQNSNDRSTTVQQESNDQATNHKPNKPVNQETKEKVKSTVEPSGPTAEVFSYWQLKRDHPQAKLDAKRQKAIKARLSDGYSVGELCEAVDGCCLSPHHMGQNDTRTVYDDIELICRDGARVDKFIKLARQGGTPSELQAYVEDLKYWASVK